MILFFVFLKCCYLKVCICGTHDQHVAAVKVEYRKTRDDSGGGEELGAQEGSASSTHVQGGDVLSPQGSRSGAKATLPPLKTAPDASEETRTEEQKKKQREESS